MIASSTTLAKGILDEVSNDLESYTKTNLQIAIESVINKERDILFNVLLTFERVLPLNYKTILEQLREDRKSGAV